MGQLSEEPQASAASVDAPPARRHSPDPVPQKRSLDGAEEDGGDSKRSKSDLSGDERNRESSRRDNNRKGKWGRGGKSLQQGSRGPNKKKNMGRKEHFSQQLDRRGRNEAQQAKRREREQGDKPASSTLPSAFPQDEIDAEGRRPKRKVAVMLGYSGTGYKGMQIDNQQKTIEGDLFSAFVAAGAISKANADDPKKSSLVRCARTDKGVHAAGNVISLKLIIEEDDIVEKINSHLSPQIRIWGIERATGSFSCYQACDSRWYEYLIPTHSFLPPHPSSFLAKKLEASAEETGELDAYHKRQEDVASFWSEVEEKSIMPILETLDDSLKPLVEKALYSIDSTDARGSDPVIEAAADIPKQTTKAANGTAAEKADSEPPAEKPTEDVRMEDVEAAVEAVQKDNPMVTLDETDGTVPLPDTVVNKPALEAAVKSLKNAYMDAKRAYRISPARIARVQEALNLYLGTRNYHNYTVQKKFKDASAKRHIKSFKVDEKPIIINNTEWLSLKVHGQSFMMHQIRKMVGMAALVVRCGTSLNRITESFGDVIMRVPKAPGLGLLLERPVFDTYNEKQADKHGRARIDFDRYDKEIREFKQKEIYERIFREEAEGNQFNYFFTHIDNYKDPTFLYLTSGGVAATKVSDGTKPVDQKWEDVESENESAGED